MTEAVQEASSSRKPGVLKQALLRSRGHGFRDGDSCTGFLKGPLLCTWELFLGAEISERGRAAVPKLWSSTFS